MKKDAVATPLRSVARVALCYNINTEPPKTIGTILQQLNNEYTFNSLCAFKFTVKAFYTMSRKIKPLTRPTWNIGSNTQNTFMFIIIDML